MAKPGIINIETTNTFQNWLDGSNELIDLMKTDVMTASELGDTTVGNATLVGGFTANNVIVEEVLRFDFAESKSGINEPITFNSPLNVETSIVNTSTFRSSLGPRTAYASDTVTWQVGFESALNPNFVITTGSGTPRFRFNSSGNLGLTSLTTGSINSESGLLIQSTNSAANSTNSTIISSSGSSTNATFSMIGAGLNNSVNGFNSTILSSQGSSATGIVSFILGGLGATTSGELNGVIASSGSSVAASRSVVISSNDSNVTIDGALSTVISSAGSNANGILSAIVSGFNSQTNSFNSVIIASQTSTTSGNVSFVIGSLGSEATGELSGVIASSGSFSNASRSSILSSLTSSADGVASSIIASSTSETTGFNSAVIASQGSTTNGTASIIIGSLNSQTNNELSSVIASTTSSTNGNSSSIISSSTSETIGLNSSIISSQGSTTNGIASIIMGSVNSQTDGELSSVIASTSSSANVSRASVISSSNSTSNGLASSILASSTSETNEFNSAVVASQGSSTTGVASSIISSVNSTITDQGIIGGIYSSQGSTLNVQLSSIIASFNSTITHDPNDTIKPGRTAIVASSSSIIANTHSVILSSENSISYSPYSAIISSIRCQTAEPAAENWGLNTIINSADCKTMQAQNGMILNSRGIIGGDAADDGVGPSFRPVISMGYVNTTTPSRANRKIELDTLNGTIRASGTIQGGQTFSDFAEMFENKEGVEIPVGTIVTLDGDGVRIANDGDDIDGVVSHTAVLLAGDTCFTWQGRYLKDEFGRHVTKVVDAPKNIADGLKMEIQEESLDYDPNVPNIPRSKRPNEWSPVGLIGQVFVRVSQDVKDGDKIKPSNGGIGIPSSHKTGLKCMKITTPYDEEKGYAVAKCLINVQV
jgi:hypothetical protein